LCSPYFCPFAILKSLDDKQRKKMFQPMRLMILANLDILTLSSYSPRNFKARVIAPDTVLLVFQVTVSGTYKDHPFRADNNAASLWMKRSGTWQNVFFLETPIPTSRE
jgi:uncharacterized protein DUF4440